MRPRWRRPTSAWRWVTGAGGENTDVVAHVAGFATGAVAGVVHARRRWPRGPLAQWIAGLASVAAIGISWAAAIALSPGGP